MMDEIIDIVNENNEVVGRERRSLAHSRGLTHRSVQVVLFDSEGRMFLQKRSASKEVCPLRWDLSAAEHLRAGEDYFRAAMRSLAEELGIHTKVTRIRDAHLQKYEYDEGRTKDYEFVELYRGLYDGEIHVNKSEIASAEFLETAEVNGLVKQSRSNFTPWFLDEWKYLQEYELV